MDRKILQEFLKELKTEGVRLQLQTCSPSKEVERNSVLGSLEIKDLDGTVLVKIISREIHELEEKAQLTDYLIEFEILRERWNRERILIQYEGYGYGDSSKHARSEAYAYVFLLRMLRKYQKRI